MANIRLYQFPTKASPVAADIVYVGDSANSFDEVQCTIAQLISAYPNLSGIAGLTIGNNNYPYTSGTGVWTAGTITTLGIALLADTTVAAMQSTLGYQSAPIASQFAGWDANKNLSANSMITGYATTATAGATTTLVVGSAQNQFFTGSTTQTVLMPVTSTLVLGQSFTIVNNSSGAVTVQSSGANNIQVMAANTVLTLTCILITGTTAASWYADYYLQSALTLPLSLANGGTNAALTASTGGIVYSGASALAILAGTATAGLALISGASAAPSWTAQSPLTNIVRKTFTTNGTYTPTAGMKFAIIEVMGAGGGGGGCAVSTGGSAAGAGGGAGGYANAVLSATQIGASATVTCSNAGGAGGTAGANAGTGGGTTTVAGSSVTVSATGGSGGAGGAIATTTAVSTAGGSGGAGSNGSVNAYGAIGRTGISFGTAFGSLPGEGASSPWGEGGNVTPNTNGTATGGGGSGFGAGGGGASGAQSASAVAGGAGAPGFVMITEFCLS